MAYATHTNLTGAGSSVVIPDDTWYTLDTASARIDEILIGAVYDVAVHGMPTDADVIDTLKRATVAQALFMLQGGDETGQTAGLQSQTIGRTAWTRKATTGRVGTAYAPDAVTILRTAGLLPTTARRWPL